MRRIMRSIGEKITGFIEHMLFNNTAGRLEAAGTMFFWNSNGLFLFLGVGRVWRFCNVTLFFYSFFDFLKKEEVVFINNTCQTKENFVALRCVAGPSYKITHDFERLFFYPFLHNTLTILNTRHIDVRLSARITVLSFKTWIGNACLKIHSPVLPHTCQFPWD